MVLRVLSRVWAHLWAQWRVSSIPPFPRALPVPQSVTPRWGCDCWESLLTSLLPTLAAAFPGSAAASPSVAGGGKPRAGQCAKGGPSASALRKIFVKTESQRSTKDQSDLWRALTGALIGCQDRFLHWHLYCGATSWHDALRCLPFQEVAAFLRQSPSALQLLWRRAVTVLTSAFLRSGYRCRGQYRAGCSLLWSSYLWSALLGTRWGSETLFFICMC